ncbi:hypothetical protein R6Q57_030007 [Mikania cordata]
MEVDDVDQDDGYEDIDSGIGGRLHSNSHETGSQHESSDDDESTVGRRGAIAPTPLPEPSNREQIFIIHGEFSNQGKATRIIGETLQAFWSHPWTSWKDISKEDENRRFDRFKLHYQWENDLVETIRYCWVKFMKKKVKNLLSRARNSAKKAASNANVEVGDNLSDKLLGRPATVDEIWMQSHGKKGTRPLDKLLISKGGERSQEAENLDEIDLQTTVKWVDTRTKDSLVQRLNQEITKLRQEKETKRQEKEKERAEKLKMIEQIEENRNANAEMKEQIHILLKNISKNRSN